MKIVYKDSSGKKINKDFFDTFLEFNRFVYGNAYYKHTVSKLEETFQLINSLYFQRELRK